MGSPPDEIVLINPGTVPKTSSGKIRRAAAREHYLARQLNLPGRALRWQVMRLWLAGLGGQSKRIGRKASEYLYAAWWWIVLAICVATGAVAITVLPRRTWRWACVRTLAQAALAAMGIPLSVKGIERLPKGHALVVFNHASYVDAIVVAAILPTGPAYLVKREFASEFFAGPLLRRLGAVFVERYDLAGSIADTAAATALAQEGRLLVVFPEGTFTRQPGLLSNFLQELSRSQAKPVSRFIPGSCVAPDQFFEATNGFPAGAASASTSSTPSPPMELILNRYYNCVTPSGRPFCRVAANRTCVNW